MSVENARRLSIAPMMDWTDRWCRRFHRLLTKRALAFTEMAVADAVIHGNRHRLIGFDAGREAPIALQLGGSDPAKLAEAARIGADFGYDEINLNVGCPSDRVQGGNFGACLMREPELVARCVAAMKAAVSAPVTVKCRIGVDDQDPEVVLPAFVDAMIQAGADAIYVHARKAWLKGLSPKDNRTIPPLDYDLVRAVKAGRPTFPIYLNGGLRNVDHALAEMTHGGRPALDGAMLGRSAYETPWVLSEVDERIFGVNVGPEIGQVLEGLAALVAEARTEGRTAHAVTRHTLGLFHGRPGARQWRRTLSQFATDPASGPELIERAAAAIPQLAA